MGMMQNCYVRQWYRQSVTMVVVVVLVVVVVVVVMVIVMVMVMVMVIVLIIVNDRGCRSGAAPSIRLGPCWRPVR